MLNKKAGLGHDTIVGLAIALVSLGIILAVTSLFGQTSEDLLIRESCLTSVKNKESLRILSKPIKDIDLNCKTTHHTLSTTDTEEIQKILADELYYCWYEFGEGKRDFLGEWIPPVYGIKSIDHQCFLCSKIDFTQKTSQVGYIKTTDFQKYLKNEISPNNQEYSKDLVDPNGNRLDIFPLFTPTISFDDPTDPYYIIFIGYMAYPKNYPGQLQGLILRDKFYADLLVVPVSELKNHCEELTVFPEP